MIVDFSATIKDFLRVTGSEGVTNDDPVRFAALIADGLALFRFIKSIDPQSIWFEFPLSDIGFHGAFIFCRALQNWKPHPVSFVDSLDIVFSREPRKVLEAVSIILSSPPRVPTSVHSGPESDDSHSCSCLRCRWRCTIGVFAPLSHAWSPSRLPNSVRRLVSEGVPSAIREHAWLILSGGLHLVRSRKIHYVSHFPRALADCPHLDLIDLDIARTYQDIPEWRANRYDVITRRILAAYALRNPTVGYCQGLSYIVGLLVTVVNEEIAFVILCAIIEDGLLPPDYYTSITGAMVDRQVLERLLQSELPGLSSMMDQIEDYTFVTIPWNMCLFSTAFSMHVSVRVWDFLFAYGPCVLFKVGLGLWRELEAELFLKKLSVNEIRSKLAEIERKTTVEDIALYVSQFPNVSNDVIESIRTEVRSEHTASECHMSVHAVLDDTLRSCVSDDQYFGVQAKLDKAPSSISRHRQRKLALRGLSQFMGGD